MDHEIRHELSVSEAQAVAHRALDAYVKRFAKYSPELSWRSEREAEIAFTAKGIRLAGALTVEPDRFRMRLDVPLLLRPFKGRALQVIDREVQRWLEQAQVAQG